MKYILTSESVSSGHPDKICDQISDCILDEAIRQDPLSRVAIDVWVKDNTVGIIGEISTQAKIPYEQIVRKKLHEIGYSDESWGINPKTCEIIMRIGEQSKNIAQGILSSSEQEQGSGDQGMVWGYATNETPQVLPLSLVLAHELLKKLKSEKLTNTRPDAKTQVSVEYENDIPLRVTTVVLAVQHSPDYNKEEFISQMKKRIIVPVLGKYYTPEIQILINGTGTFEIGGPKGDSGFTGRKIIVDTYGGIGRHGGGAFSGKDPSKVDRSAAYAARYIAKNIVTAKIAKRAEVQISYCIGIAKPISIFIHTFGEAQDQVLTEIVQKYFPIKPKDITEHFQLTQPTIWNYEQTSVYGHFTQPHFPWEKTDKTLLLREEYLRKTKKE